MILLIGFLAGCQFQNEPVVEVTQTRKINKKFDKDYGWIEEPVGSFEISWKSTDKDSSY